MKVELRVLGGDFAITMIALMEPKYLVGRAPDCHLRPASDRVSRHHCVFKQDEYSIRLRDLGSTNGTFVNNERINGEVVLNDGDVVQVGDLTMQVFCTDAALADTAVQGAHDTASVLDSGDSSIYEADTTVFDLKQAEQAKAAEQPAEQPVESPKKEA